MKSLDIINFKANLEAYIKEQDMPMEVIRMVLAEIYQKAKDNAYNEAMAELKAKEIEENGKENKF